MRNIELLKEYTSKELFKKVGHVTLGPIKELFEQDLSCDELLELQEAFNKIEEYHRERRYQKY